MDIMASLRASYSGLQAQRARMNVISSNLANADVTRTAEGGPYIRKEVVFAAVPQAQSFEDVLQSRLEPGVSEVRVVDVANAPNATRLEYDPDHPDANAQGYVAYPNINVLHEMTDLIAARRMYGQTLRPLTPAKIWHCAPSRLAASSVAVVCLAPSPF
jgi:flagellar basal-body rod protein FlgC